MTDQIATQSSRPEEPQCYNCGGMGHWAVACPEPTPVLQLGEMPLRRDKGAAARSKMMAEGPKDPSSPSTALHLQQQATVRIFHHLPDTLHRIIPTRRLRISLRINLHLLRLNLHILRLNLHILRNTITFQAMGNRRRLCPAMGLTINLLTTPHLSLIMVSSHGHHTRDHLLRTARHLRQRKTTAPIHTPAMTANSLFHLGQLTADHTRKDLGAARSVTTNARRSRTETRLRHLQSPMPRK
ncbi:Zinc finger, CCHC-type [Cordyceps fumosorosea ARSEF 2679]|uniref:Zinc finger, CCHC-type n=1 Tax=Cordyceps fumosorosea (strain ARSEF 2679) TaxID=1081104 RepID=A0A162LEJ0_CORFA|nr:Zinc finger, CCHC-type [Cordyceps fumosorosea ARSEF 2679]OAA69524.1 Zinc finger, CCHC-type [Cordyceps fumosorosea ARSEF 2679]